VTDPEVVSGNPELASAALAAVRKWRYKPVVFNGEPVEVITEIEVPFQNE
jgi:protein TonB